MVLRKEKSMWRICPGLNYPWRRIGWVMSLHHRKVIFPLYQCYKHLQVCIHREQLIYSQVCSLKYLTIPLFISNRRWPLFVVDIEIGKKFLTHMLLELGNIKCRLPPVCAGMKHRLYPWFSLGSCDCLMDNLRRDRMNLSKYFLSMEHSVKYHMMKTKR